MTSPLPPGQCCSEKVHFQSTDTTLRGEGGGGNRRGAIFSEKVQVSQHFCRGLSELNEQNEIVKASQGFIVLPPNLDWWVFVTLCVHCVRNWLIINVLARDACDYDVGASVCNSREDFQKFAGLKKNSPTCFSNKYRQNKGHLRYYCEWKKSISEKSREYAKFRSLRRNAYAANVWSENASQLQRRGPEDPERWTTGACASSSGRWTLLGKKTSTSPSVH